MSDGDVGAEVAAVLYEHREHALTCFDHDDGWCCICGEHEIQVGWRQHVAEAIAPLIERPRATVARVRAIYDSWIAWDGSPGPDGRIHPDSSSPRDRDRLRAALDPEGES